MDHKQLDVQDLFSTLNISANKSQLSKHHFEAFLAKHNISILDYQLDTIFELFDEDHRGKISLEDFKTALTY